jgi:hypothetical protein
VRIDGPLLRRQRQWPLELTERTTHDDEEHLEGILSLLDEIADQAHDRYGIASLLEMEATNAYDFSLLKRHTPKSRFLCNSSVIGIQSCVRETPIAMSSSYDGTDRVACEPG